MPIVVTRADLAGAKMQVLMHLDYAGFYENHYACIAHPALIRVESGPRGRRSKVQHSSLLYVDGEEVPGDLDAIAAALTAYYARQEPVPFDYEAEMDEAGEP